MRKTKFIILAVVLFGVIFKNVLATMPSDYKLINQVYQIDNGTIQPAIINTIIYCQGGKKYRIETESIDIKSGNKLNPMVAIVRLDKNLMWVLDLENKTYMKMLKLSDIPGMAPSDLENKFNKIGEEKILNSDCSIYVSKEQTNQKYWISNDSKLVLKMETGTLNRTIVTEAKEIKFESQDDSLFEIPSDFKGRE